MKVKYWFLKLFSHGHNWKNIVFYMKKITWRNVFIYSFRFLEYTLCAIFKLPFTCCNICAIHRLSGKNLVKCSSLGLWGHLIITTIKEIEVKLKGLEGSVRPRRMRPCGRDRAAERGKDPPRSTPSQIFQESVSMRQLRGEAFISLMHCITAGPSVKSQVSLRLDEKDPNWIPPLLWTD